MHYKNLLEYQMLPRAAAMSEVQWVMPKQTIIDEITNGGTLRVSLLKVLMILVKFVCPIAIFIIFLHQFNLI